MEPRQFFVVYQCDDGGHVRGPVVSQFEIVRRQVIEAVKPDSSFGFIVDASRVLAGCRRY